MDAPRQDRRVLPIWRAYTEDGATTSTGTTTSWSRGEIRFCSRRGFRNGRQAASSRLRQDGLSEDELDDCHLASTARSAIHHRSRARQRRWQELVGRTTVACPMDTRSGPQRLARPAGQGRRARIVFRENPSFGYIHVTWLRLSELAPDLWRPAAYGASTTASQAPYCCRAEELAVRGVDSTSPSRPSMRLRRQRSHECAMREARPIVALSAPRSKCSSSGLVQGGRDRRARAVVEASPSAVGEHLVDSCSNSESERATIATIVRACLPCCAQTGTTFRGTHRGVLRPAGSRCGSRRDRPSTRERSAGEPRHESSSKTTYHTARDRLVVEREVRRRTEPRESCRSCPVNGHRLLAAVRDPPGTRPKDTIGSGPGPTRARAISRSSVVAQNGGERSGTRPWPIEPAVDHAHGERVGLQGGSGALLRASGAALRTRRRAEST